MLTRIFPPGSITTAPSPESAVICPFAPYDPTTALTGPTVRRISLSRRSVVTGSTRPSITAAVSPGSTAGMSSGPGNAGTVVVVVEVVDVEVVVVDPPTAVRDVPTAGGAVVTGVVVVTDVGESGCVPVPIVVAVPLVGEPVLGATVVIGAMVVVEAGLVVVDGTVVVVVDGTNREMTLTYGVVLLGEGEGVGITTVVLIVLGLGTGVALFLPAALKRRRRSPV